MFIIPKTDYAIRSSRKKGRGAFALKDIEAGTVIGDYIGTIIKSDSNDEKVNGLYDMRGGVRYDILADPKEDGIHLINHSCANNCDAYPYGGHILYVALRKIFKGEEITVNYGLGGADEKDITCGMHACHCNSKICTGTMHEAEERYDAWYDAWEKLVKRNFGAWYRKVPGRYGERLRLLEAYPATIDVSQLDIYPSIFGSEAKPAQKCSDTKLPSLSKIRERIRKTGKRPAFPKLDLVVDGIRDGILLVEKK
jgi:hypothetical protein